MNILFTLLLLCSFALLLQVDAMNRCEEITRCSECVFDPSDGLMPPTVQCGWCAATGTCLDVNSSVMSLYRENVSFPHTFCEDLREQTYNPSCPDMRCAAAHTTNNIYICRPLAVVAIVFGFLLLIVDVLVYIWMRTIRQLPWRYEPFLSLELARESGSLSSSANGDSVGTGWSPLERTVRILPETVEEVRTTIGTCAICKLNYPEPLGPGEVCFWCGIARFAFFPLFLGIGGATVTIVVSFVLSLKPWFSDYYFAYSLIVPFAAYAAGAVYVVLWRQRVIKLFPIPADASPEMREQIQQRNKTRMHLRETLFVQLTLRLRGRRILTVFPQLKDLANFEREHLFGEGRTNATTTTTATAVGAEAVSGAAAGASAVSGVTASVVSEPADPRSRAPPPPPPASVGSAPASTSHSGGASVFGRSSTPSGGGGGGGTTAPPPALTPEVFRQKKRETAQLLSSVDVLKEQYRSCLVQKIQSDECILWWVKPRTEAVVRENDWLIAYMSCGVALGVWLVLLSTVTDNTFAIVRITGSTSIAIAGIICVLFFFLLILLTVRGCNRVYVLTNKRLLTVYDGLTAAVVASTDLSTVKYAAVQGYCDILSREPCLIFSWEIPATERKMPPIKSHKFPAITNMPIFLKYFKAVAPKVPAQLRSNDLSMKHERSVWRMHLFFCAGLIIALPLAIIYPRGVPGYLSTMLYVIILVFLLITVKIGLLIEQMTYAPLNLAEGWVSTEEAEDDLLLNAQVGAI